MYIFLDVDGVLNTNKTNELTPLGYLGIDDNLVAVLKKVVDKYNAKIVLSSDWKEEFDTDYEKCGKDGKYLVDKLVKYDLTIIDKTKEVNAWERGQGILDWLKFNDSNSNYIIFDDNEFDFCRKEELKKHVIETTEGILDCNPLVENCIQEVKDIVDFLHTL